MDGIETEDETRNGRLGRFPNSFADLFTNAAVTGEVGE